VKATLRFTTVDVDSTTSGLRYEWPAFIEERGSCTSRFWSRLREDIKTRLKDTAILEPRDEKRGLGFPIHKSIYLAAIWDEKVS
jgi:hypothetical protein